MTKAPKLTASQRDLLRLFADGETARYYDGLYPEAWLLGSCKPIRVSTMRALVSRELVAPEIQEQSQMKQYAITQSGLAALKAASDE